MLNTVCILGGGGQLGSQLINEFSKHEYVKVIAVDKIFENKTNQKNIEYIELDLSKGDYTSLLKVPKSNLVFINCIGLQHAVAARKIYNVNFKLNKNVYSFIANNFNLFHYIYISSLSVRNNSQGRLIPGVGNPINLYGKSKLEMERFLKTQTTQKSKITIIRPAAFYGRRLSLNLENFFDLLINKVFVLPIKNKKRSFLSLGYLTEWLFIYCNSQASYFKNTTQDINKINIFEIGDKEAIEFNLLIKQFIENGLNVNSKILKLPTFVFKFIGKVGYFMEIIGIHVSIFTILGEFAYNFEVEQKIHFEEIDNESTYDNFLRIAKDI